MRTAATVLRDQSGVRKLGLRILVERLLVGVGGSCVKVKVAFLDIFTVVAFAVSQAEQAFLEDRIFAIPQSQSKTQAALSVAPSKQTIFAPPVNPAPRVIVREILPARTVRGIVFTHRAPLAF